ncbi:MAG: helix-turn-helix domain-containing protein [candidate division Zixibacteria bacterium]|nr:helix-turn-helix domain-containing protein [candidate division Zixibacteria bacterium]
MSDTYKEIGDLLAAARREKQKTLEEAADITKIAARYLAAVEAGDPKPLPSKPYFLLFARSYAQYLGVNPAALEEIEKKGRDAEVEASAPEPAVTRKTDSSSGRGFLIFVAIIVIVAVTAVLFIRWRGGAKTNTVAEESPQQVAADEIPGDSVAVDSPLVIPASPYQSPGKLVLVLWPRRSVGVVLVRDGDTVLNRRLELGEQQRWEADYRFLLSADASAALNLTVNDQSTVPLTLLGPAIFGLEINQANYKQFLPPDSAALNRMAADSVARTAPPAGAPTREGTGNGH